MSRITFTVFALFFLFTGLESAFAQADATLVDELRTMVRYLSSDELEGRRTGTRGNLLAAGYIAGEFAEAGLKPVDGRFLHDFPYMKGVSIGTDEHADLWYVGETGERRITLPVDLKYRPLGFSKTGPFAGELAFVGYGISAPDEDYDDYANIDVTGKMVVMFRRSPDGDNAHSALTSYSSFVAKAMTAREKGASGMIIIDPEEDAGLIPLFMMRGFKDAGITALTVHQDELEGSLGLDPSYDLREVREAIDRDRTPNSFAMPGYKIEGNVDIAHQIEKVPNVLGMIPGTDPVLGKEIVIVGGHFDHLGHGGEGSLHDGDDNAIHNGADDNASGTAAVIALARIAAREMSNRRTMVFMAFNGEEEGLLGSSWLAKEGPFEKKRVVAMINLDMVGRMDPAEPAVIVQGMGTSSQWEPLVESARESLTSESIEIKPVPDGYGPSDHSSFYGEGVPVLFFFTGLHSDYHRPSDDWNLVNYKGLATIVHLVDRVVGKIDRLTEAPDHIEVPRRSNGGGVRLKVVLGVIPDYGFGGEGLRITGVREGGAAEVGGMKSGDIIISIGETEVNGIEAYMYALKSVEPGDEIDVRVMRGDEEITLKMKPAGR